ncbi:transcription factor TGAL4-like isoform X2 [Phragmites australis]|uniref:transcription factor TGAL4-like isoform X2 n=1 Tax=Phragmites australis TaxID=29695 RepID=UPI002D76EBDA|nr:transcription factor TGAL4-like isoform X2 [Phragmites australis]
MGETSSSSSHSRQDPCVLGSYGFHGAMANSTPPANFFDQEGATYFGELEEAFMHQVAALRRTQQAANTSTAHHGDTTPVLIAATATATAATATARPPPTLDIFPSWPMRSLHTPKGSNVTADSTDSGSSSKNNSDHKASSDQLGVAANMASQFDQVSKQQQHKNMATSSTQRTGKTLDPKTIRRLAQNREAARKSRLRKKAYIQQLESSKLKLSQMEQDIQRARSQGILLGGAPGPGANSSSGAAMFDMEHARWLDDQGRRMAELHGALHAHLPDGDLRAIVDDTLTHYDQMFRLKAVVAKSDVFHLITGKWASPAERCFLWMGGFKPSDLLKTLLPQLDPLTEHQVLAICNLQQSSQQAEEALSQGLEQLHQSLADTMAGGSLIDDANMSFMGQMALALGKLSNLEGFVIQADNLRQQTLHQMHRILTVRQAARCFLAIGEYHNRLRALSSLWASRPREILVAGEVNCGELSIAAQPSQNQFTAF